MFKSKLYLIFPAGLRYRRDVEDDLQDSINDAATEIDGFFKHIYGATCVTDDQCLLSDYISKCHKAQGLTRKGYVYFVVISACLNDTVCKDGLHVRFLTTCKESSS